MDIPLLVQAGFQWWQPISWVIAALGIGFGIFQYRRNRHPAIRIEHIEAYMETTRENPAGEMYLTFDLLCHGADLYDVAAWLEAWYGDNPSSGQTGKVSFQFPAEDIVPNPLRNGQHVKFKLPQRELREFHGFQPNAKKFYELPAERVSIVIYTSGKVELRRIPSTRFLTQLRRFTEVPAPGSQWDTLLKEQ